MADLLPFWLKRWNSVFVCSTKSVQGAGKLVFGEAVALGGEVPKCQIGACDVDLDLEMRSKFRSRLRNLNWPYLKHF